MPSGEGPSIAEDFEARPLARLIAAAGEISGEIVPRSRQLGTAPAKRSRPHQRSRGLAEGARLHLLPESGHSSLLVENDIDDDPTAADRRSLLDARLRVAKPLVVRNGSGKA